MRKLRFYFLLILIIPLGAFFVQSCGDKGTSPKEEILGVIEEADGLLDEISALVDDSESYADFEANDQSKEIEEKLENVENKFNELMEKHKGDLSDKELQEIRDAESKLKEKISGVSEKILKLKDTQ